MGDRQAFSGSFLSGSEGELLLVRVEVAPRWLEDLLEVLAGISFPINPQILHGNPTVVEFPAYRERVAAIQSALQDAGATTERIEVTPMLEVISRAG